MPTRRKFLAKTTLGTIASLSGISNISCTDTEATNQSKNPGGINTAKFISTWEFGQKANAQALATLQNGGSILDAVEQGVRVIEADGSNSTVGYGGMPDRDGRVTLDACIMDSNGMCGSVCSIEHIMHPVSVARMVMEKTPHVMLIGDGALEFALNNGMEKQNLLTPAAKRKWEEWKVDSNYKPIINIENHDTIGMLGIDNQGNLAGACTTSGLAFKMRGRVGDSPVIGAGLYIDNEVGGAAATGLGEAVLRTLGSFLIVELMRQGASPSEACKEAIDRIIKKHPNYRDFQVGFIAINKQGVAGSHAIHQGFSFAESSEKNTKVVKSPYFNR